MTEKENVLEQYAELYNRDEFLALNEEMTFSEYIKKVKKKAVLLSKGIEKLILNITSLKIKKHQFLELKKQLKV